MKTKTETSPVWLSKYDMEYLPTIHEVPLSSLSYTGHDMTSAEWVKVGTAEITVTYREANEMREQAAESIRAQMADAAAKYQAMQTELQDRLNKLLAIGYEEQA